MDPQDVKSNLVLILDFGSQYTHLITRRIRALNVFSLCINGTSSLKSIADLKPSVIILSGGPHSVHALDAPCFPSGFMEYVETNKIHVLGICYGLQLIVQKTGGEVRVGEQAGVWEDGNRGASRDLLLHWRIVKRGYTACKYHPEVTHSPEGMETLRYFLFDICGVTAGWKMEDVLEEELKIIKDTVGPDDHVICALSGGVDSTVAATLVHKAIGDRLHCAFVDNGLLRFKERERVMETFEKDLHLPVTCIDATEQFLSKLIGVTEPEKKRKIIGNEFICIFDAYAHDLEKKLGKKPALFGSRNLIP
ncbi:GMP synthase (glutamine-hydrolyzing) [Forsythia ovata]|uniref:GMP synthase (Glutamine-hydrolyzing) n=1 Tax=Forsythia ovata TaxID=205694 RepID=A0ABD1W397_9LAMI